MRPIPRETTRRKLNTENELKSVLEVSGSNAMGNMHTTQDIENINYMNEMKWMNEYKSSLKDWDFETEMNWITKCNRNKKWTYAMERAQCIIIWWNAMGPRFKYQISMWIFNGNEYSHSLKLQLIP